MTLPPRVSFEQFATDCGLRMTPELLYAAPRDVLAPLDEADEYVLMTVRGPLGDAPSVRLLFMTSAADAVSPTIRDALWWLAADAWAIERANGNVERWAGLYGYPPHDPVTKRHFARQSRQTEELRALLGMADFQRLLGLYEQEVSAPRAPHRPYEASGR